MVATYSRPNIMFEKGEGSYMYELRRPKTIPEISFANCLNSWDSNQKKYLDFTAGIAVNSLGHADKGVTSVIADQV